MRWLPMIVASCLASCSMWPNVPESLGERNSGFTYIPLDPLPVAILDGSLCERNYVEEEYRLLPGLQFKALLDSLPDNAVRVAVKEYDLSGEITYGPASIGKGGQRYQVVLDYINVDTSNMRFYIKFENTGGDSDKLEIAFVKRANDIVFDEDLAKMSEAEIAKAQGNIVIPVYVGVGLRLTADIQVLRGNINLSSLAGLAAGVEAGKASGSLVVQTLGVTGKQVSTSLPLPSELNQTTVQNAILALGSIKAIIYDKENTLLTPRVTGIYLPLRSGSEDLVNRIVSELAREPIPWERPCERVSDIKT